MTGHRGRGSRGRERDSEGSHGERCEGMTDTHGEPPKEEEEGMQVERVRQPVPDAEVIWTATHCTGTDPV